MSLLSPGDQEKLRESFDEMTGPVRVLFFTQTLDCDPCVETRQILDELPALSDKIAIDEVNFILEKDKAAQYGIDRVPALALLSQDAHGETRDTRGQLVALRALPSRARVERHTLHAAVEIDAALRAAAVVRDRQRQQVAAARAAADFVRRHQIRRLRAGGILQLTARRPVLLRRTRRRRPLRATGLVLILIAALSVLSV